MLTEPLSLRLERLPTPIGEALLLTDRQANLRALDWAGCEPRMYRLLEIHYGAGACRVETGSSRSRAAVALDRYFQGELAAIDDLPVATGGTAFQRDVWRALRKIPCGSTASYAELARQVGRPLAIRAVGTANGSNPVGVVVPCHRVIGSDGSLTGYAGGIERKRWLLQHESHAR